MRNNVIYSINGPVVTVRDTKDFSMLEMVRVGDNRLIGEVISMNDRVTTIQVYENTTSLSPGEPVEGTGAPICATLGPGMLENIFDGIERPLKTIEQLSGAFIPSGVSVSSLDEERLWDVTMIARDGDTLAPGQIIAVCPETEIIMHRSMVPPGLSGVVSGCVQSGQYNVTQPLLTLTDKAGREHVLSLAQRWPIRTPRPCAERLPISVPLITGQRIVDTMFPIAKGGTAAIQIGRAHV